MTPARAAIYARVSTRQQTAHSLDAQIQVCRDHAEANDLAVGHRVFTDVASASDLDRPGLRALLESASQYEILLIARIDRLTRSIHDWCHLLEMLHGVRNERHCTMIAVNMVCDLNDPGGRYMAATMVLFGEFERHTISDRTARALAARAGRSPYAVVLPLIAKLRSAGESLRSIAAHVSAAMGREVAHSTIRYLVKNHIED